MVLLLYFSLLLLLLILKKNRTIAVVFIFIHVVSLLGIFFTDGDYVVDTIFKGFNVFYTATILTLLLMSWSKFSPINRVEVPSEIKLKRLTYFLIAASVIPFITFIAVSFFVLMYVDDINTFKYAEGVSDTFYYNLPINIRLFILSNYLYYLSYFLIPLHFYYLIKRNYKLSVTCFIFSLNIVLYGLTYFSRSVYVHYSLVYLSVLYILFNSLDTKIRSILKRYVLITTLIFVSYFIYITNVRFLSDKDYSAIIPAGAYVEDPVIFSYLDYISQWYRNGLIVLNSYNHETFGGQISLQSILSLLGQYNLISYSSAEYMVLRQKLWPDNWYTFNGFVAYSVFDYGYELTFIFSLIFYYVVIKLRPINNSINIINLFLLVLLIQLPLMAIFYSQVGGLVFPILYLIPIYFYLRVRWSLT